MDGHWNFQGGGGSQRPTFLKESMELNWNFEEGGGGCSSQKIHSREGKGWMLFWNNPLNVGSKGWCL